MNQRIETLALGLFVAAVCPFSVSPSTARAALPAISCTPRNGLLWCVSFDGANAQAGVGNQTNGPIIVEAGAPVQPVRVELVYYWGTPQQGGEQVIAGPFSGPEYFYSVGCCGQSKQSPVWPTWRPGTYCSRMYLPERGFYQDVHCVNTDGVVVGGNACSAPYYDVPNM